MRKRPGGRALLLAPLLVLAGGCGDVLDNVPPRPAVIEDAATAEADFPDLAAVPARPRLSYSLEQRREIAEGLVADRANARYAGDHLRQALDRPVQPDTTPPLPPLAPPAPPAGERPGDLALAYVEEALARDSDDGSLGDFLDRLQQPPPAVADFRPVAGAAPADPPTGAEPEVRLAAPPAPVAAADPAEAPAPSTVPAEVPAPPTASALIAGAAAPAAAAATEGTATPVAAPPSLPLAILFAAAETGPGDADQAKLQRLARQVAQTAGEVVVSGGGSRPGIAMERARRVAALLVSAGLPAAQIAIEMGGESDVVVVYEAGT